MYVPGDMGKKMFISHTVCNSKNWNQPQSPSTVKWEGNLWQSHDGVLQNVEINYTQLHTAKCMLFFFLKANSGRLHKIKTVL